MLPVPFRQFLTNNQLPLNNIVRDSKWADYDDHMMRQVRKTAMELIKYYKVPGTTTSDWSKPKLRIFGNKIVNIMNRKGRGVFKYENIAVQFHQTYTGARRLLQDGSELQVSINYNSTDDEDVYQSLTEAETSIDSTELITELNQDPEFDITGTIEETVSTEESSVTVIDYADNYDNLSEEQQSSLSYEVSEGNLVNEVVSSSQDFTVPTGIYELMIKLEDGNSNAISFRLRVQPNDVLSISIDSSSTSLSDSNGDVLASADGSQASGSGSLLGIGSDGIGSQGVSIAYFDQCPSGYTNVHSDFDPELLPESSLYLTNGVPDLKINFQLPEYYFNIEASYGSEQCPNNSGNVVSSTNAAGCNSIVHTSVNHQDDCNFNLIDQGNGKFIYQGVLTISAKLLLNINGYSIERTVQAPLSWQVELANEISVTSDVEVKEDALCYSNNDCTNDQGCC